MVSTVSAAVAALAALASIVFAWLSLRAGKDTTEQLRGMAEQLRSATEHALTTVEELERARRADRLSQRLDQLPFPAPTT